MTKVEYFKPRISGTSLQRIIRRNDASILRPSEAYRFFLFFSLILLGYALDNRGFAYVGFPPIFISEITLLIGIVFLARARTFPILTRDPIVITLFAFCALCFFLTVTQFSKFGLDAFRDGVIWIYSIFALVVAGMLIADPQILPRLLSWFRIFSLVMLVAIPPIWVAYHLFHEAIPKWPFGSAGIPMIFMKEGDVGVHLAGILAFFVAGLGGKLKWPFVALMAVDIALCAAVERASLLTFLVIVVICIAAKPREILPRQLLAFAVGAILLLWITGISFEIPGGKGRKLSFDQLADNLTSIGGDSDTEGSQSNKDWRTSWWLEIWNESFGGPNFLGHGFGLNLAEYYHHQVLADQSLRSSHSIHFDILARAGVPGFFIWLFLQGLWGYKVAQTYFRAQRLGDTLWAATLLFLFCYWLAHLINGSLDVFIQGPMGGIWFWAVFGAGIGVLWLYNHRPKVLDPA